MSRNETSKGESADPFRVPASRTSVVESISFSSPAGAIGVWDNVGKPERGHRGTPCSFSASATPGASLSGAPWHCRHTGAAMKMGFM
jgi:hypothetical protein